MGRQFVGEVNRRLELAGLDRFVLVQDRQFRRLPGGDPGAPQDGPCTTMPSQPGGREMGTGERSPHRASDSGPFSYDLNYYIAWPPPQHPKSNESPRDIYWGTCDVRGAGTVPVFFDTAWYHSGCPDFVGPPPFDTGLLPDIQGWPMCINRHDGGVNVLFMDWSVRKVGLKELWTLKWSKRFNTAGPWTTRGGARPEDWPQWMRRFKDY